MTDRLMDARKVKVDFHLARLDLPGSSQRGFPFQDPAVFVMLYVAHEPIIHQSHANLRG